MDAHHLLRYLLQHNSRNYWNVYTALSICMLYIVVWHACNIFLNETQNDNVLTLQACSYFLSWIKGCMKSSINKQRNKLPVAHFVMTCGGCLYQELLKGGFIEASTHYVSVTLNTDGIPMFKSSNFEFWPLFMLINELPYRMRYIPLNSVVTVLPCLIFGPLSVLKENRIFAGLWYRSKPNVSLSKATC